MNFAVERRSFPELNEFYGHVDESYSSCPMTRTRDNKVGVH